MSQQQRWHLLHYWIDNPSRVELLACPLLHAVGCSSRRSSVAELSSLDFDCASSWLQSASSQAQKCCCFEAKLTARSSCSCYCLLHRWTRSERPGLAYQCYNKSRFDQLQRRSFGSGCTALECLNFALSGLCWELSQGQAQGWRWLCFDLACANVLLS